MKPSTYSPIDVSTAYMRMAADNVSRNIQLMQMMTKSAVDLQMLPVRAISAAASVWKPVPDFAAISKAPTAKKAVVKKGKVRVLPMMEITMSFDHRVIDGGMAQKFLGLWREGNLNWVGRHVMRVACVEISDLGMGMFL